MIYHWYAPQLVTAYAVPYPQAAEDAALAALRNFGPVLFYVGLAIFGAVGLVIAGAIMGAVI